jgi:sulfane dehydrogenase subunit SoxC
VRHPHDPDEHDRPPAPAGVSRRALLGAMGGLAGLGLLRTRADAVLHAAQEPSPAGTRLLGALPSPLGQRAPGEQLRREVTRPAHSGASLTPLGDLEGIITPSDLHFERHHGGVPAIDPAAYTLLIHGLVDRPRTFTLQDIKRFPAVSRICFVECSGNGRAAYRRDGQPTEITPQTLDGMVSTSEWVGVPLATLFREVGVKPGATWFLAESHDAVLLARSIPVEKGWEDAMIAWGQNGEALRPEQGYPARLLLPGWEGNPQIKWIRRIELADRPVMTRDETSKYTEPLADGRVRQFSFVMDAKSLITFPAYPYALPERGWWEIRGLAWSGRGRITRVDVSSDGGRSWTAAALQEPVLPTCTTRFRSVFRWDGEERLLLSRAVDETGYVQPMLGELLAARGEGANYHANNVRAWKIARDGRVTFGLGDLT